MHAKQDVLAHDLPRSHEPAILHAQSRFLGTCLADAPADESRLGPVEHPLVMMGPVDGDVRPGPEEAAVVQVVGREVVGQDFAIQPVERMDVGAVRTGRGSVFLGACPMVVDQDGPIAVPEAQRSVVDLGKPERARGLQRRTAEPGRLTSRTAIRAPKFVTQPWVRMSASRSKLGDLRLVNLDAQAGAHWHGQLAVGDGERVFQDRALQELGAVQGGRVFRRKPEEG